MDTNQNPQTNANVPPPPQPNQPKEQAPLKQKNREVAPPRPPGYLDGQSDNTPKTEHILQPQSEKNLYNSSWLGLFFRNFTAGFARALGSLIVYIIFLYVGVQIFKMYVLPEIQPYLDSFQSLAETATATQEGNLQISPDMINQVIQQMGGN